MLVIIIPLVLLLISIYFLLIAHDALTPFWINKKKYKEKHKREYLEDYHDFDALGICSSVCVFIVATWLFIDGCCFINLNKGFAETIYNYEWLSNQIDKSNCDFYAIGGDKSFADRVFSMNEKIIYHKSRINSSWNSVYMSKDIAQLEPLTLDISRFVVKIE